MSQVAITQSAFPETLALLSAHKVTIGPPTPDTEALMVFMPDSLDEASLRLLPNLKIVAAALKGCDNFDVEACTRLGIWFTIVPDLLTEPTAELALALMLGLARNVLAGDRLIRSGEFQGWRPILYGTGLAGSTVGIVGFGAVGRALARMLEGFSCRVLYCDPSVEGSTPLDIVLASSDFVLPLLPLTAGTFHLLGREALALMKRGAYLINVSRGSVVDEEAIADALESGHLAGYAADTFEMEDWARSDRPREISPRLLRLTDRTLFTPHLGSAVASARREIERAAATNILQALGGERPSGAINNPEHGCRRS
ncbi:MAG TPA: NAD(P)-dependent oxidoreductase [Bryobacteraceae bacterium]|nr:NAD(P)-dependent oxidoreductase [Bryobacteraceae bacterium]